MEIGLKFSFFVGCFFLFLCPGPDYFYLEVFAAAVSDCLPAAVQYRCWVYSVGIVRVLSGYPVPLECFHHAADVYVCYFLYD